MAKILAPVSDGLELNLSCPHATGYGMAMGQDPELVREITAAVKAVVNIPVIPKLTPNTPNIAQIAAAARQSAAKASVVTNLSVRPFWLVLNVTSAPNVLLASVIAIARSLHRTLSHQRSLP